MRLFAALIQPIRRKAMKNICTLAMLRLEIRNVMQHGLVKHKGDWFHQWARTGKGTLSYLWHY